MAGGGLRKGVLSAVFFGVAACAGTAQACGNEAEISRPAKLGYKVVDDRLQFYSLGHEAKIGQDGGIEVSKILSRNRCVELPLTAEEEAAKKRADTFKGFSATKVLSEFITDVCDPAKSVPATNFGKVEPTDAQMDAVCKAAVKSVTFKMNK